MSSFRSTLVALALVAVAGSALALALDDAVVGEVVDQSCFLRQEAHGADHQECAARCLRNGNPAGILTDDGTLYTIAAGAAGYESFAAKRLRVSGKTVDHAIFPESVQVWEDDAWVEVPLTKFGAPETK